MICCFSDNNTCTTGCCLLRDINPNNVSQLCPSDTSSTVTGLPLDRPQWALTLKCQPCQVPTPPYLLSSPGKHRSQSRRERRLKSLQLRLPPLPFHQALHFLLPTKNHFFFTSCSLLWWLKKKVTPVWMEDPKLHHSESPPQCGNHNLPCVVWCVCVCCTTCNLALV